ncbi:hypothetical protein Tsp_00633 [Trichinella spiralis]|uniref:Uncharacterized protein n=1 Tax=Trichinella spiralis TaxID=6334 RepID=E5SA58_TRISP|nr:hypothetical protein Tsp_00633 [Trichinella spiralis]KRY42687.1 hypothetical protein T01_4300 [Trichinella spiralis]
MLINLAQVMIIIYLSKAARNWTPRHWMPMQLRHVREHLGETFFPKLPTKTTAPQTLAAWQKYFFSQSKLLDNCFSDIHLIEPGGRGEGEEKQLAVVSHNSPTRMIGTRRPEGGGASTAGRGAWTVRIPSTESVLVINSASVPRGSMNSWLYSLYTVRCWLFSSCLAWTSRRLSTVFTFTSSGLYWETSKRKRNVLPSDSSLINGELIMDRSASKPVHGPRPDLGKMHPVQFCLLATFSACILRIRVSALPSLLQLCASRLRTFRACCQILDPQHCNHFVELVSVFLVWAYLAEEVVENYITKYLHAYNKTIVQLLRNASENEENDF